MGDVFIILVGIFYWYLMIFELVIYLEICYDLGDEWGCCYKVWLNCFGGRVKVVDWCVRCQLVWLCVVLGSRYEEICWWCSNSCLFSDVMLVVFNVCCIVWNSMCFLLWTWFLRSLFNIGNCFLRFFVGLCLRF